VTGIAALQTGKECGWIGDIVDQAFVLTANFNAHSFEHRLVLLVALEHVDERLAPINLEKRLAIVFLARS
jgi:hypothetical protein